MATAAASIITGAAAPVTVATMTRRRLPRRPPNASNNFGRGKSALTRRTATIVAAADAEGVVVSPSPRDPSVPSDWWKDAIVYQVCVSVCVFVREGENMTQRRSPGGARRGVGWRSTKRTHHHHTVFDTRIIRNFTLFGGK